MVYQKGDPLDYHLTWTHRPTSASTTILTWSPSQALFLIKFSHREWKIPVLGVEAKQFCKRNNLLMKNSTIESSLWNKIISYWYIFFLIKSSLIYKELYICFYIINKKKKMKKKNRLHLIYNVSRLSLIYSIFLLLLFIFSLTAFMTLWFNCINFLSWWESSTHVRVFHYENDG